MRLSLNLQREFFLIFVKINKLILTHLNKVKFILALFFVMLLTHLNAAVPGLKGNHKLAGDTSITVHEDDPIAAMLDSLKNLKFFQFEQSTINDISQNVHNYDKETVPVFDDLVYERRMAKIDAKSPFKLDYNPIVRSYIDMYTIRKRYLVSRMLGLAQFYFPIFEERLDKYNMPLELKYLAIVESAMNPNAVSPVGATGLWQFMYGTGKMFGLNVTSYVDDRRDPYKATEAACQYFKFLYDMFHDWQLVLAAYNSGPGNVNKAIRRSGGRTNFWEIKPYLPKETQGYVPAFIAVAYVMNYTKEHNLYPIKPKTTYYQVDTVKTREQVTFRQIAEVLSVPMEDIEYLNPMYKHRLIPNSDQGNTLVLPIDKIGAFITNESSIYAYKSEHEKLKDEMAFMARKTVYKDVLKVHKVRKGENLASIARKYDCTSAQLKKWNHLKSGKVSAGKRINVYVKVASYEEPLLTDKTTKNEKKESSGQQEKTKEDSTVKVNVVDSTEAKNEEVAINEVDTKQSKAESNKTNYAKQAPKVVYYRVQKGDTLWRIAQKYDGVSVNDLRSWNKLKGNQSLKAGTKIKVNLGT